MKIIKRGRIEHYTRCEYCGTEMIFDANDLQWTHTEPEYYFVTCPVCGMRVWMKSTPELDALWRSIHGNVVEEKD